MNRPGNTDTLTEITQSRTTYERSSEILKALSHPVRLKILQVLLNNQICVSEIVTNLKLPQAIISHHLSVLRNKQVLTSQKKGTRIWYMINDDLSKEITSYLKRHCNTGKTR